MWAEAQRKLGGVKTVSEEVRTCKMCGEKFSKSHPTKCFCSEKCRTRFNNRKSEKRVCILCGKEFETRVNSTATRCSDCWGIKIKAVKKRFFKASIVNTPAGPDAKDMWMPDIGTIPVVPQVTGAKAVLRISPGKMRKPPFAPTRDHRKQFREKLTGEEIRLLAELELTNEGPREHERECAKRGAAASKAKRKTYCNSWTAEQDRMAMEMRKKGEGLDRIAAATGRTYRAVEARLRFLREKEADGLAQ
jgi:hypothetical protein